MVCVGIDVAKDKHGCFILNSKGEALAYVFTIANNREGFETLLQRICPCTTPAGKIRAGLEAAGHYSYNILRFLLDNGMPTFVLTPLRTNLYQKASVFAKPRQIALTRGRLQLCSCLMWSSSPTSAYNDEELRSLTRYRFDKVLKRAKLKQSVSRLVVILFPELEKLAPTLRIASVYTMLNEFPGAKQMLVLFTLKPYFLTLPRNAMTAIKRLNFGMRSDVPAVPSGPPNRWSFSTLSVSSASWTRGLMKSRNRFVP